MMHHVLFIKRGDFPVRYVSLGVGHAALQMPQLMDFEDLFFSSMEYPSFLQLVELHMFIG